MPGESRSQAADERARAGAPVEFARPSGDSIGDAVSPKTFACIRNERYECAQSISAFLLLRYTCDV